MRDSDIRQRLAYGDQDALADVYDLYSGTVYAVALAVTCDATVAEEITVEAFVGLWDRPLAYDPGQASLRGWLAMQAHRRSVEWLRDNNIPAQRVEPERPVALAALPELTRQAIELAYFHGRTYQQVAIELGIPANTAKSRLRAGLRDLAANL
ncbi:RNA polymerase sigma-70 factor (ECF subfamily) [Kibdelosporangium banguiense]|uniref:RNA polymerase sigma-70 factor (ECF subfamily) n=1 Tax=Kibdelosporangium banguiense TaxID=1365924 RepID=A0ABS4TEJ4_9PSEU|nr:sigma factor-like helix-turn-helix DNA-binding protein [Kibdelosporangium banguiense]MBP2322419.1 RNA polymerase sigma-70 factor (ECF subfamily) [Kibdelosporangium banguiense]